MEDHYESVLATRYCKKSPLIEILSERNKVTKEAIEEMKSQRDNIDWPKIRDEERRLKHDVMAHNHAFGAICPNAAGIIHLGATSCYVQDNADLIVIRDSVQHLLRRTATVLDRMATFADREKSHVTVGRTHYQTASLVTVGKRAALWAQELLMAFKQLEHFFETMRFRGIKGATGTQDSFLTLFSGDEEMVEKLDDLVTGKAGFTKKFCISGQTYSRQQDVQLIFALASIGAAVKKICTDIRVLQAMGELLEPFEKDQIGSSAMPYKKNPMKSERCCSLARKLIHTPQEALSILSDQGLERTLDDSAGRRLEKAMMMLTEEGVDRQEAHAVIRATALDAKQRQAFGPVNMQDILQDSFFASVRDRILALVDEPIRFTGRCESQTVRFINDELRPAIKPYFDAEATRVQLDV
ncbi:unnamed protein product [Nippostrongylus brasiliensis]|uniref:Adenylosuccinate lyase (inferred by orthology to a C. elegans protein) n=1 Tax=Nippostrongylus brasiliensis TaxID=27835 RepID=A0A0N4Y0U1_NIPBR|nr:unnamed protein product [Nippostrongylus brasiliensis]